MHSLSLLPDTAERVSGAETETVPISELHVATLSSFGPEPASQRMARSSRALLILTSR